MGQDTSSLIEPSSIKLPQYKYHQVNKSISHDANHQNILRIAKTPFEGCEKVEMEGETYFIEHTKNNMAHYLKSQIRLKKRFSDQEIIKIIENVSYALAFLESANIPYPLLSIENVFRCRKEFKILPPVALKSEIYCKLKRCIRQKIVQFVPASPQMIIAARCQQPEIEQKQILFKSNVFAFGLVLLQVCTHKPSSQCYDLQTYEILDEIITQRIEEIQQNYSNKIVRVIANMLDYDYEERMTPKQLSVWINREFHGTDQVQLQHEQQEQPKVIYQKQQQQRNTVRSRFVIETENGTSGNKQLNANIQTKNLNSIKTSEKRMNEIRSKINKEKKIERITIFDINSKSTNSLLSKSSSFVQKQVNRKKFIPNPYLNEGDLNMETKNAYENKGKNYEEEKTQRQTSSSSKINDQKCQNRYQYQQPNVKPSKGSGLKYKYDIDSDDENKYSPNPNNFDQGSSSKRNYARGYLRNSNQNLNCRNDDKSAITSDFNFEPFKYQQLEETKKINGYEKCDFDEIFSKRTLFSKQNYEDFAKQQNMFQVYKNLKQNPYQNRMEKSEHKNYRINERHEKQNNKDIFKIKQQIQKPKNMIEYAKRNPSDRSYL